MASARDRLNELRNRYKQPEPVDSAVSVSQPKIIQQAQNIQPVESQRDKLNRLRANVKPGLPKGDIIDAVVEPIQAIASSGLGSVAAGLTGIATLPAGLQTSVENIKSVENFANKLGAPETKAGQESLDYISGLIEKGVDLARIPFSLSAGLTELVAGQGIDQALETVKSVREIGLGETAGNRILEETSSPLLATIAQMSPEITASLIPITRIIGKNKRFNTDIANRIKEGSDDIELAKFKLKDPIVTKGLEVIKKISPNKAEAPINNLVRKIKEGATKIKSDKNAIETIRQGFDQGVVQMVKAASKTDKLKFKEMLDITQRAKKSALFRANNRPTDIAGNSLLKRVKFVKELNKRSGKMIDFAAKGLTGKAADFKTPMDNFIKNLDEIGIKIDRNLKPDFKGSDIEFLSVPENAIKNIVRRLSSGKSGVPPDALQMHKLKRFIDSTITFGAEGKGLKGNVERILKDLRKDIDTSLDKKFKAYDNANTIYADSISALGDLRDALGSKIDLFGPGADKAIGTKLRGILSNVSTRTNLNNAIDSLTNVSLKHGAKFDDNITAQMLFAEQMDSVFKITAKTSLGGEVSKAVSQGIEKVTGGKDLVRKGLKKAVGVVDRARSINEENAFKSMNTLLKELNK